ncbi:hypothetical protein [Tepidibacter mesophilus]|uniref:hypothetical protein n=1 Tax=Tepidibacter mesophilus TaxID=655607 RepID=UPI000C0782E0|nr:hypothetical protein [Tepidibacter mesophilus]
MFSSLIFYNELDCLFLINILIPNDESNILIKDNDRIISFPKLTSEDVKENTTGIKYTIPNIIRTILTINLLELNNLKLRNILIMPEIISIINVDKLLILNLIGLNKDELIKCKCGIQLFCRRKLRK